MKKVLLPFLFPTPFECTKLHSRIAGAEGRAGGPGEEPEGGRGHAGTYASS